MRNPLLLPLMALVLTVPVRAGGVVERAVEAYRRSLDLKLSAPALDGAPAAAGVAQFTAHPPAGLLGVPLGAVVRVRGTVRAADTRMKLGDADRTLLAIESVDGRQLTSPAVLIYQALPGSGVKPPAPGAAFELTGFETGGFTGLPERAMEVMAEKVASGPFVWESAFVAVKP